MLPTVQFIFHRIRGCSRGLHVVFLQQSGTVPVQCCNMSIASLDERGRTVSYNFSSAATFPATGDPGETIPVFRNARPVPTNHEERVRFV